MRHVAYYVHSGGALGAGLRFLFFFRRQHARLRR